MFKKIQDIKFIPRAIWIIGFSGFLINVSTAIVFGLSTGFMRYQIGMSIGSVGKIQNLVEALSYVIKFASGIFSDIFRRRKILMLLGLGFIAISKPIIAGAQTVFGVFLARGIDRIGNGIQSTPRDALIGDLSDPSVRGQAFGLRYTLSVAGSALGSFLAILLMFWTGDNYRLIFLLAGIPCAVAFLFLLLYVPDPIAEEKNESFLTKALIMYKEMGLLGSKFWQLILIVFVFMLCRYGEAPLILNAIEQFGLPERYAPTIMVGYNLVTSLIAYPVGFLSDKIGRERILMLGVICALIANLMISYASNLFMMYIGVAAWGAQIGITTTMFIALIADYAPVYLRGTAFSIFYCISAISVLISGHIYELCIEHCGSLTMPFRVGAVFSFLALILILLFMSKKPELEKITQNSVVK